MKTTYKILAFSISALFVATSCNNSKSELEKSLEEMAAKLDEGNYTKIDIDSLSYTIDLPEKMTPASSLNDDASLQYSNPFKNQYIIVIDEPKTDITEALKSVDLYDDQKSFMENFVDYKVRFFEENATKAKKGDLKKSKINGLETYQLQADAIVEGVPQEITYFFAFIEGPEDAYMIMAWTLASDKDKYAPMTEKMINSFRVKPTT